MKKIYHSIFYVMHFVLLLPTITMGMYEKEEITIRRDVLMYENGEIIIKRNDVFAKFYDSYIRSLRPNVFAKRRDSKGNSCKRYTIIYTVLSPKTYSNTTRTVFSPYTYDDVDNEKLTAFQYACEYKSTINRPYA